MSRPVEFTALTWAQLMASYTLAGEGDIIRISASPITATSDFAINKSLTFALGGSLTESVWTLGDHTITVGSTTSTGAVRLVTFNGPFTLSSTATGPVWGTGTANAVLEVSNTGADSMTCVLNNVTVDANSLGDRCVRSYGLTGLGVPTLICNNCTLQNALDDNVGGTNDSGATGVSAHTILNSCTCSVAVNGNNLGAHYYGRITTTSCTLTGGKLTVAGVVSFGNISISGGTAYWPAAVADGQGATPSSGPPVFANAAFAADTGGALTVTNVGITNAGTAGSHRRLTASAAAAATSPISTTCSIALIGCTITQSKGGGSFQSGTGCTMTIQDCVYRHVGDTRDFTETSWSGTQFNTSPYALLQGPGTLTLTRSIFDCQQAASNNSSNTNPILRPTGTLQAEGCVFARNDFATQQNGLAGAAGVNVTNSYIRGCEFIGRLGSTAINDAVNWTTANTEIEIEGTLIRHWNNGINGNSTGSYPGDGYNVFKGMVNKNVANFGTKATDQPPSNATNVSATTSLFNETMGSLNAKPSDQSDAGQSWTGATQSTEDLYVVDSYKIERWPITIGVVGGGTVTRSPLATARWTQPNDSGAYTKEGQSIVLTATPNAGYSFSGWSGAITGSTNPATMTVVSTATSVTATFVAATGAVGTANGAFEIGNLVSRRHRPTGSSVYPVTGTFTPAGDDWFDYVFQNPINHLLIQLSPTTMSGVTCYVAINRAATPAADLSDWDFVLSGDAAPPRLEVNVGLITRVSLYFAGAGNLVRTSDFNLMGW